jgi:hypothetical protein
MPPSQCPQCGRFLSRDFVLGLATEASPCPKCDAVLSPAQFPEVLGAAAVPDAPDEEPAGAAQVRAEVAKTDPDPLAGWDEPGGQVVDLERFRQEAPPADAVILAGTGLFGAVVGALVSERRGRGALVGLLVGLGAAATARQVWKLPDE